MPVHDNPSGLCQCGCGQLAPISEKTNRRSGWVKGQPKRFIKGHMPVSDKAECVVVDRGFRTPCWEWQKATMEGGYGQAWDRAQKRLRPAHCVVYERVHGPIPEGMELDHLCRNRRCVNPNHVEPVTGAVNAQRGLTSKLTAAQVDDIRERYDHAAKKHGLQSALAREFSVSAQAVHQILHRRHWQD
jgi:hypothetical protein